MSEEEQSVDADETHVLPMAAMEPDITFSRYTPTSEFKKSKKRQVPYETLDYSIYKLSASGFKPYISVIILDLKQTHSSMLVGKSKKKMMTQITIQLCTKTSMDNLLTITIYINTGRIQIQGKTLKEWGNTEFKSLVKIIDDKSDLNVHNSSEELDQNLNELKQVHESMKKDRNKSNVPTTETYSKVDPPTTPNQTSSQNEATTPHEKSFTTIKTQVEMLEPDVVNFKQEILKSMEDVMETLQEKNKQLNDLNEKIGEAHSNETVLKQTISDLTLKQYEQQQEIYKLKHMNKNQQQELKTLKIKLNNIQHKNNDTEPQVNNQKSDGTP
jgi:hypothetical protein